MSPSYAPWTQGPERLWVRPRGVSRLRSDGTGDAEPLLRLRKARARLGEFVLHLVPEGRSSEAVLHDIVQVLLVLDAMEPRPIGYIIIPTWEEFGFWKTIPTFRRRPMTSTRARICPSRR